MRNYLRENSARYQKMQRMGVQAWVEWAYGGSDTADFSSRGFLDDVIPRLRLARARPTVLELGTGVGPGAIYLAARGFEVRAVDVIPDAIEQARLIAAERDLKVRYEVMDVTQIPHRGPGYDLIVDSYCLQGVVLDEDREAVFRAVKARLNARGYYLLSSAVYDPARHRGDRQVVDRDTGRVFDRYDKGCLYERDTDLYYEPYAGDAEIDGAITVDGGWFFPFRRYRDGARLREEVEAYGFKVLYQLDEIGGNLVAVHRGSGVRLRDTP